MVQKNETQQLTCVTNSFSNVLHAPVQALERIGEVFWTFKKVRPYQVF